MFKFQVLIVFVLVIDLIIAFGLSTKAYLLTKNGFKEVNAYIVGGTDARETEFPYQVSLQDYGSHICGASIISAQWLVTAAHCIEGRLANTLTIRYGSIYLESGGQVVEVIEVVVHPLFSFWTLDYDIALIRTKEPIKLDSVTTKTIGLPDENSDVSLGKLVTITGWGYTKELGDLSPILQKVTIPVIDRSVCKQTYKDINEVTDNMFCAGLATGGVDACQGDSGGPVVENGILVGAVSWGYKDTCARPDYYGVYTRIAKFRNWIKIKTLV